MHGVTLKFFIRGHPLPVPFSFYPSHVIHIKFYYNTMNIIGWPCVTERNRVRKHSRIISTSMTMIIIYLTRITYTLFLWEHNGHTNHVSCTYCSPIIPPNRDHTFEARVNSVFHEIIIINILM